MDRDFVFELTDEAREAFVQNLGFIARGERMEETETYTVNDKGEEELTGVKRKRTKDPKTVLQSMVVLDALTGGQLGIAKAADVVRGEALNHVKQPKRLPAPVDDSIVSNRKAKDPEDV